MDGSQYTGKLCSSLQSTGTIIHIALRIRTPLTGTGMKDKVHLIRNNNISVAIAFLYCYGTGLSRNADSGHHFFAEKA